MPTARKSTRRDFLRGRSAAQAVQELAASQIPLLAAEPEHYLTRFTRRAMACEFEVILNAGQYPQAGEAALAARRSTSLVARLLARWVTGSRWPARAAHSHSRP
jgi:hypothetical protein